MTTSRHDDSERSRFERAARWLTLVVVGFSGGCGAQAEPEAIPDDAIVIGAALPFSGPRASTGIGIERALMLAVEDVNDAGGVDGHPLYLKVLDSNSGSDRGYQALVKLLRDDGVEYLIGPEEDSLALDLVKEIKAYDRLNILPSLSAPRITDSGNRGAWIRMVPSALTMGCALATKVTQDGVTTTRTIAARDDYHLELASVFGSSLSTLGGRALPTVTVADDQSSYAKQVSQAQRFDSAEATVMLAYPRTAAAIVTDLSRGKHLRWYFSPMLRDDALLWNVPQGSLSRAVGISPSLSQNVECTTHATSGDAGVDALQTASVRCDATIAERFSDYFASHWQGRRPLDAGHFYYDGVVMLALALQAAAEAGNAQPTPQELLPFFTGISTGDGEPVRWDSLAHGLELASNGTPIHYEGAAGEYEFNARGQNVRAIVSTWQVNDGGFVESQSVSCPVTIRGD